MDKSRRIYVLAQDGMIYNATLRIAKTRDGRNLLYAVNLDINNGVAVDKGANSREAAVLAATPMGGSVAQKASGVKQRSHAGKSNSLKG